MKSNLLFALILISGSVLADVNLPVVCTGIPDTAGKCQPNKYDVPDAGSLVLTTTGWRPFSSLLTSDALQVCKTEVPAGSISDPKSGLPCTDWPFVAKSTVVPVAPPNTTGRVTVTWTAPTDATPSGYNLYSAALGEPEGLVQSFPANVLQKEVGGLKDGTYSFWITAVYGTLESSKTGPAQITVKIPVQPSTPPPGSISITNVTIEPRH